MKHTPYGYRIENGMAVVDEERAKKVKKFFEAYLSGLALAPAAVSAGINLYHGSAGRMLRNKHYLGDDYYPAIIDKDTFEAAEVERLKRAGHLGRIWDPKEETKVAPTKVFVIGAVKREFTDPFKQAEYAYSLIMEGECNDAVS